MIWLFWLLSVFYAFFLLVGIIIWARRDLFSKSSNVSFPVSVIVPFRNESGNLELLVVALQAQEYENFEVIFVDDHSEDGSFEILNKALESATFRYVTHRLDESEGKKAAIANGISKATGEIVLTTDADCLPGVSWIQQMVKPFQDKKVQLVAGPVELTGKGVFQRWQQMEFSTLIALGGILIRTGMPAMANGANLAYRKLAFEEVGGFQGIDQTPSGDDELLMMKINRAFPKSIRFRKNRKAIVVTPALENWAPLKQQRLRWAGKWRVGARTSTTLLATFVFLLNLSWLVLPLAVWAGVASSDDLVSMFRLRMSVEAIWLIALAGFFKGGISVRAYLLHQLLYPFYVLYFGVMANFGNYQWKGRSYSARHNKYD